MCNIFYWKASEKLSIIMFGFVYDFISNDSILTVNELIEYDIRMI